MKPLIPNRPTAREILAKFGGAAHAEHSAAWRERMSITSDSGLPDYTLCESVLGPRVVRGFLVGCSCGSQIAVAATEENKAALRNVPEGRPS